MGIRLTENPLFLRLGKTASILGGTKHKVNKTPDLVVKADLCYFVLDNSLMFL